MQALSGGWVALQALHDPPFVAQVCFPEFVMPHELADEVQPWVAPAVQTLLHVWLAGWVALQALHDWPFAAQVCVPEFVDPQLFAAEVQAWVAPATQSVTGGVTAQSAFVVHWSAPAPATEVQALL